MCISAGNNIIIGNTIAQALFRVSEPSFVCKISTVKEIFVEENYFMRGFLLGYFSWETDFILYIYEGNYPRE